MLVQRGCEAERRERARHFKSADRIHVRRYDRDAAIALAGMLENEFARDIDFRARRQGRALRADQNVPEIKLDVTVDVHGLAGLRMRNRGQRRNGRKEFSAAFALHCASIRLARAAVKRWPA